MRTWIQAVFINLWLFFSCSIGLLISPFYARSLDLNYFTGRLFSWGALRLAGIRLEVQGREIFDRCTPCVMVANHQSGLDVATFGNVIPHKTLAIGKIELLWIPFFGQYFWAARNVIIKRQDRRHSLTGLTKAVNAIRERRASIFVFPEGTRNRSEDLLLPFKKGAFHMAIDAQVPIVPVVKQSLKSKVDWRSRKLSGGVVKIRILEPIPTTGMTKQDVEMLTQLTRERMMEAIRGLA